MDTADELRGFGRRHRHHPWRIQHLDLVDGGHEHDPRNDHFQRHGFRQRRWVFNGHDNLDCGEFVVRIGNNVIQLELVRRLLQRKLQRDGTVQWNF